MIVADASALVDLVLNHPRSRAVRAAIAGRTPWHVPHLVDVEALHALRRWWLRGDLTEDAARGAWAIYDDLPLVRHGHVALRPLAWSVRSKLSAYDATYVALADTLAVPLVTADARLARGAAGVVDVSLATLNGTAAPADLNPATLNGTAAPADLNPATLNGAAAPADLNPATLNGTAAPADLNPATLNGAAAPADLNLAS